MATSLITFLEGFWSITERVFTSFLGSHLSSLLAQQLLSSALREFARTAPLRIGDTASVDTDYTNIRSLELTTASPTPLDIHRNLFTTRVTYKPAPLVIFFLGAPGVGKGTQSAHLKTTFPLLTPISYGDTLRKLRVENHPWVVHLPNKPTSRTPDVPDDMAAHLLWQEMRTRMDPTRENPELAWLVDGFPRRGPHLKAWMGLFPAASLVIHLHAPKEVLQARVGERGKTSGRPEDASASRANERIEESIRDTPKLLEELRAGGVEVFVVDGNREEEVVREDLAGIVRDAINKWMEQNPVVKGFIGEDFESI